MADAPGGCLHRVLERTADRFPDRLAVLATDGALTYGELERRANQVAHTLLGLGVRPGDRVGLALGKSAEAVVAVYGVLKSGAAYVPLAPEAPAARVRDIVRHADIRILLAEDDVDLTRRRLLDPGPGVTDLVCLRDGPDGTVEQHGVRVTGPATVSRRPPDRPDAGSGADDLAYVLYTSGSTGRPKGVMLTHRNALSFVEWSAIEFGLRPEDRLSNHAPLHFDLSVFDLFAAAHAGAAVVLVPPGVTAFPAELARFVRDNRISVWYSVPSSLNLVAARGGVVAGGLPDLRLVLFAGEVFPVAQLRKVMSLAPAAEFANLYGPTETNVCTCYRVPRPLPDDCPALPIGVPIEGVEVFARTEDGRPAEVGEIGELWVRGPTVMLGYLGDDEQTARALCAPAPGEPPAYRTGDLGTRDADGRWHFLGRRDNQIKSRGYRIEPGEIESAISAHPAVVECAVVGVPDALFGSRIKAFVVLRDRIDTARLTAYCRTVLPAYLVPWAFEVIGALPRTPTGKVDHQVLKPSDHGSEHVGSR